MVPTQGAEKNRSAFRFFTIQIPRQWDKKTMGPNKELTGALKSAKSATGHTNVL